MNKLGSARLFVNRVIDFKFRKGLSFSDSMRGAQILARGGQIILKMDWASHGFGEPAPAHSVLRHDSSQRDVQLSDLLSRPLQMSAVADASAVSASTDISRILSEIEKDFGSSEVQNLLYALKDKGESALRWNRIGKEEINPLLQRCVDVGIRVLSENEDVKTKDRAIWFLQFFAIKEIDLGSDPGNLSVLRNVADTLKQFTGKGFYSDLSSSAQNCFISIVDKALSSNDPNVIHQFKEYVDTALQFVVSSFENEQSVYNSPLRALVSLIRKNPWIFKGEKIADLYRAFIELTIRTCDSRDFCGTTDRLGLLFDLLATAWDPKLFDILFDGARRTLGKISDLEAKLTETIRPRGEGPEYTDEEYELSNRLRQARRLIIGCIYSAIAKHPTSFPRLIAESTVRLLSLELTIPDSVIIQERVTDILHGATADSFGVVRTLIRATPYSFKMIGARHTQDTLITIPGSLDDGIDPLMRVIRINIHSEQNRSNLDQVRQVLKYWQTKDRDNLSDLSETSAYDIASREFPELLSGPFSSPQIDELSLCVNAALNGENIETLRSLPNETVLERLALVAASDKAKSKTARMIDLYLLLLNKYGQGSVSSSEILEWGIADYTAITKEKKAALNDRLKALAQSNTREDRLSVVQAVVELRTQTKIELLTPREKDVDIDVYQKRHIAPGREGIFGTYKESKFDLFNFDRRVEVFGLELLERIINEDIDFRDLSDIDRARKAASLLIEMLKINGISNRGLEVIGETLSMQDLSATQVRDLFNQINSEILAIQDRVMSFYSTALQERGAVEREKITAKILRENDELNLLGALSIKVLNCLSVNKGIRQAIPRPAAGNIDDNFYLLVGRPGDLPRFAHARFGSKGANLIELAAMGLPVPPALLISNGLFYDAVSFGRSGVEIGEEYISRTRSGLGEMVFAEETVHGRSFPHLFSVRSGSYISLPGMMETITNIGLNPTIAEKWARTSGNPWFVYDSFRRMIQGFGMAGFGIERGRFNNIINRKLQERGVLNKNELSPDDMREVAMSYLDLVKSSGFCIPENPFQQVLLAMRLVLGSWFNERAISERTSKGLSHDWGTGITIQAMRFGNIDRNSGSGVMFTSTLDTMGDYAVMAQGEDVVDGTSRLIPIAGGQSSLSGIAPTVSNRIIQDAGAIESFYHKPTEVELTVEAGQPWYLQARGLDFMDSARATVFDISQGKPILQGAFGFGGAVNGVAVLNIGRISEFAGRGDVPIFITEYLVPDDAAKVTDAGAFVAKLGGITSHMALLSRRHGKTMVGGVDFVVESDGVRIGGVLIKEGDRIGVDGFNRIIVNGNPLIKGKA